MEFKPIEKVPHCGDCPICDEGYTYFAFSKEEVRQLEANFKKTIEALEEIKRKYIYDCKSTDSMYQIAKKTLKEIDS